MGKYYMVVMKDAQAISVFDNLEAAMSAYHSELASDYLYFADGTIDFFTVMVVNQSGDSVAKEFKFRQEGA